MLPRELSWYWDEQGPLARKQLSSLKLKLIILHHKKKKRPIIIIIIDYHHLHPHKCVHYIIIRASSSVIIIIIIIIGLVSICIRTNECTHYMIKLLLLTESAEI